MNYASNTFSHDEFLFWNKFFLDEVEELRALTGMNVFYSGKTWDVPHNSPYQDGSEIGSDISFYFGPPGSTTLLSREEASQFGDSLHSFQASSTKDNWRRITHFAVHINSERFNKKRTHGKYLKYYLGQAMGLRRVTSGSEIMNWNSNGLGTPDDPRWGPGDKAALGQLGNRSGGCL